LALKEHFSGQMLRNYLRDWLHYLNWWRVHFHSWNMAIGYGKVFVLTLFKPAVEGLSSLCARR